MRRLAEFLQADAADRAAASRAASSAVAVSFADEPVEEDFYSSTSAPRQTGVDPDSARPHDHV